MNNSHFLKMLKEAQSGNAEALEAILQQYEPLIRKYSYLNGKLDEDLRQYIFLQIILNINRFEL